MHVVQCNAFQDPQGRPPEQLLAAWPSLVDIARATQAGGCQVSVVQASALATTLSDGGIDYHFVPATRFDDCAARLCGDVLHLHGLRAARWLRPLRMRAPSAALLVQDHADRVPRTWWRRALLRRWLLEADAVTFCASDQWLPFRQSGLLAARTRLYAVPESTSGFTPGSQREAQRDSGLHGSPCIVWVGHLDGNKDPLTLLDGIAQAAEQLPGLRLWCHFGSAPLRAAVERRIAADPRLRPRVQLLGCVPHRSVERALRAADVYVSASHREGSGYALIEALACGATPVVSDIPSFRALTGGGQVGSLWPVGDAGACARALLTAWRGHDAAQRARVRSWFDARLSFPALGRRWQAVYADVRRNAPPAWPLAASRAS